MFTASDPSQASGKAGVGTELLILDKGDGRPDWTTPGGAGIVYQVEGAVEDTAALARARADLDNPLVVHRAVICTLGVDPAPWLELGITTCMPECYLEQGPTGLRKAWQAHEDGWPWVWPVCGVYGQWPLSLYVPPMPTAGGEDIGWPGLPLPGHTWGIYLAEGMTDTGSWSTLASLTT